VRLPARCIFVGFLAAFSDLATIKWRFPAFKSGLPFRQVVKAVRFVVITEFTEVARH
jgi:hypothetical protein